MASIVINADDFGLSDGICRSISELLRVGAVSNTTLMVAADGAVQRMRAWGVGDLLGVAGVHLQLTNGTPVSPAREVPSLVNPDTGRFLRREEITHIEPKEVELEWTRQIELATELLGGSPTHLDGHKGITRIAECVPIFISIASRYGIEVRGDSGDTEKLMQQHNVTGSVNVVRSWTGRNLGAQALIDRVNSEISHNAELIEVITHPGFSDPYLESISSLNLAREGDHSVLMELLDAGWPDSEGHQRIAYAGKQTR